MPRHRRYELSAADGTPSEREGIRRKLYAQPRVATIGRAAELLGISQGDLAALVAEAELEPFAVHANGEPTYRFKELGALVGGRQP